MICEKDLQQAGAGAEHPGHKQLTEWSHHRCSSKMGNCRAREFSSTSRPTYSPKMPIHMRVLPERKATRMANEGHPDTLEPMRITLQRTHTAYSSDITLSKKPQAVTNRSGR